MHHKKLDRWLQFGGHSDGDTNSERVAIREFQEESGIDAVPTDIELFDIDAHRIPERGNEPEHTHFDVVFLGVIPKNTRFHGREAEVDDIRWFSIDEARKMNTQERMQRMFDRIESMSIKSSNLSSKI